MIKPGLPVEELPTPCVVVDLDIMERNIAAWQDTIGSAGAALRPHVKTHKIPAIAAMQLAAGAGGITVAKVAEAEVFAAAGMSDMFIAYPVIGREKWERIADLARTCRMIVGIDSETGVRGLSAAAAAAGVTVEVRVEIEMGMGRSGIAADLAPSLCRLAMELPGIDLNGLYGYRSVHFPGGKERSLQEVSHEEGRQLVAWADAMRADGIPIREISAGSTPTARHVAEVPGVTEVRPGTYVFSDYMNCAMGYTNYDEVALSIMCTVVSRPGAEKATVDGGSKTFCGDIFPSRLNLDGYARSIDGNAFVESMSEEHGVVRLEQGADWQVGDRVTFHPIHVCTTVNLSDELVGVRNGHVETVWPVAARGKRT